MITHHRTLDRIPEFDVKSKSYGIMRTLDLDQPRSYTWDVPLWLDQGSEGACVSFAWNHNAGARPRPWTGLSDALAFTQYKEMQRRDEWPGEAYSGTSVLAGAKYSLEIGRISEYRWAFGLWQAMTGITRKGPAVLGLDWYEGMFNTDSNGFLRPTGAIAGGHAILAYGGKLVWLRGTTTAQKSGPDWKFRVDLDLSHVKVHNSWGPSWGNVGRAKISFNDFDHLLRQQGEVCIPIKKVMS